MTAPEIAEARTLIALGLAEDLRHVGDVTSQSLFDDEQTGSAQLIVRETGVICGLNLPELVRREMEVSTIETHRHLASRVSISVLRGDGYATKGTVAAEYVGPIKAILALERLTLNLMGRLSGVSNLTSQYVAEVRGTKAVVCDTRKTTPSYRLLEKYAVRAGGGTNHRMGLFDAILIKDNHVAGLQKTEGLSIDQVVARARSRSKPGTPIEIEVDNLTQFDRVLASQPTIVLLDNMSLVDMRRAVEIRKQSAPAVLLEASGGITLRTIRGVAETGVDRISVGALTHSAKCFDLALDWKLG